jgi:putative restriction endonuclease
MRYWWVNQNQTHRYEIPGGFLWSPKRKSNGGINPYYESMREVAPGDIVLSFIDTRIAAWGVALSHCREFPKPAEFGSAGKNWDSLGWRINVKFSYLQNRIRPADYMDQLGPLLPSKYSPLLADGRGSQSIYLVEISQVLFDAIRGFIGAEIQELLNVSAGVLHAMIDVDADHLAIEAWDDRIVRAVDEDSALSDTERSAVIQARRGQGLFRQRVAAIETRCRVTGVDKAEHLRASHSKPWRDSSNDERLDGENGLLLTPSIDHLFDRGFIGFESNGDLVVSPAADMESLQRMGLPATGKFNVGQFSHGQRRYLDWHLERVFLKSRQSQ